MTPRRGGADERRHPRFKGDMVGIKFRRLAPLPTGEPDVYHNGNVIDISVGGMCFDSKHAITRGEKIEYHINAPSGDRRREGAARVIRVGRDRDRFYVAVEFVS
ncbi:MAG TPA: PilZ domain-containing protein [Planctomycetota bacterium]|nr:PilZ domain-containing protein [Planctomycetota bacterium]HUV38331.1 PilZ domain-containing protein [Planctomycetota bacterium]